MLTHTLHEHSTASAGDDAARQAIPPALAVDVQHHNVPPVRIHPGPAHLTQVQGNVRAAGYIKLPASERRSPATVILRIDLVGDDALPRAHLVLKQQLQGGHQGAVTDNAL